MAGHQVNKVQIFQWVETERGADFGIDLKRVYGTYSYSGGVDSNN